MVFFCVLLIKQMKGVGCMGGEPGGWGWGKVYQNSQCIFLMSNTIQHVIVEMALVKGNSVIREKGCFILDNHAEMGFEVQVTLKKAIVYASHELLTKHLSPKSFSE